MTAIDTTLLLDAVSQAVKRAVSEAPIPRHRPASVVAWDQNSHIATVRLDGETGEVGAALIGTVAPGPGDRVLVLLVPPHGAWMLGAIESGAGGSLGDIPFGGPDLVTTCTTEALRPRSTIKIGGISATLRLPATIGSVSIQLLKNGGGVASMTIPTGQTYLATTFTPIEFLGRTDSLAVFTSISSGQGAVGLGGLLEVA